MDKPTDMGTNRTGIATSPIDSKKLIEAAERANTIGLGDGAALEAERIEWARNADPIGTVPPPGTVKGMAKATFELLKGHKANVLIDKLGERLAYERAGTRLYDALLAKFEAASVHAGGPTRFDLETIRDEEHAHLVLVRDALKRLGADPTAMTPGADIVATAGLGWVQVLADPRTTFTQCLDVLLIIEGGDVEGWSLLVELTGALGFDELAGEFRQASLVEEEHEMKIRNWLTAAILGQAGAEPTAPQATT
ncbi:MAG: ferritin-like domain-containing protein [Kofleriaceae bacterium]|nr:ferritin-like domain-containing protein [Kofleriaceae bacterium]